MLFTYGINRLYTVHNCIMWAIELPFTVALPYSYTIHKKYIIYMIQKVSAWLGCCIIMIGRDNVTNQQEFLYMCIKMSAGFVTLSFLTDEDPGIGSKCLNQVTLILSYNFLAI